jgi:hypothetical protein
MMTLTEVKIVCPKDGYNIFTVKREFDVGSGTPQLEGFVCRRCEPHRYNEILRNARKIVLLSDKEPQQHLKTK